MQDLHIRNYCMIGRSFFSLDSRLGGGGQKRLSIVVFVKKFEFGIKKV